MLFVAPWEVIRPFSFQPFPLFAAVAAMPLRLVRSLRFGRCDAVDRGFLPASAYNAPRSLRAST